MSGHRPTTQVALLALRRLRHGALPWAVAALLAAALALRSSSAMRQAPVLAAVLAAVALLVLWASFTTGVLRQNAPTAARLVPGHPRRLRAVLIGGWALLALLQAALVLALGGSVFIALELALALLALAVVVRYPVLWTLVWLVPSLSWWWADLPALRALGRWVHAATQTAPVTAALAVVALALPVLALLVSERGNAAALPRGPSRAGRAERAGAPPWARLAQALRRAGMAPYHAWLRHLCRRRPRHDPMARALLVLGSQHWSGMAAAALLLAAVSAAVLACLWLAGVLPLQPFDRASLVGASIGLMSFAMSVLAQVQGLHRVRREQALLMLVPGLPRGSAFSRALALRLTLWFLLAWGGAGVLALALVGLDSRATPVAGAAVFGTLPFAALLWRDWSRAPPPGPAATVVVVAALVLSVLLLALAAQRWALPLQLLAAGSVVLTAALLAWRWWRLGALPAAWPVGRNAGR